MNKQIPIIPQPPYSPDLTPCDLQLFPRLEIGLRCHHFACVEENQQHANAGFIAIPKENFQRCFHQ
jgi:hypothetical protein